jgi:hypothetical protein
LVPGSGGAPNEVHEIVLKHGEKPAMKMDGMMLKMLRRQMEKESMLAEICKDMTLVGGEMVSVPAGRFKTQHFHSVKSATDTWTSTAVSFSLVKNVGAESELRLLRQGDGAKSSIIEQPKLGGLDELLAE